ncbi:MAG: hypothetical protein J6E31_03835 [Pyramidobacter sp.]|nr:hypothetical protein [Pyramidobacter sp.]
MSILKRLNLDIFYCFCLAFLLWILCLNLKEILLVQAWRHDALYYLGSYLGKLKTEGRWINYYLFSFLKAFPAHGSALLCVVFFSGFAFIAANKGLPWRSSRIFTLLLLQISPIYSIIHWPATPLPANFFLFLCAYLSRKYRYEYVVPLAGILFHSTFNNLYNLVPLLYIGEIKTVRKFFKFLLWWTLSYILGYAIAQLMTKLITGQFVQIAAWRNPHFVTSFAVLEQNLKRVSWDFISHLRAFGYAHAVACLLVSTACLWKKSLNTFQLLLLLGVGLACYAQSVPVGIGISLRTAYPLYAALLFPFYFALQSSRHWPLVLSIILFVSSGLFTDNINALRYYNGVTSVWKKYLNELPIDPKLNSKLIFLGNNSECQRIERHLMWTINLNNRITEGLGSSMRWHPVARSLGYKVVQFIWAHEKDVKRISPKWLDECVFQSNMLYQWTEHEGTVVVRFNQELLKTLK